MKEKLSKQELQATTMFDILQGTQGYQNKISKMLGITEGAVAQIFHRIFQKLNVKNKYELIKAIGKYNLTGGQQ